MSEEGVIERSATPLSVSSLTNQLQACGLTEGQTVLVHLAMSKLGWVIGGAEAVILALLAAVGARGTIMMVTNSSNNTDPYEWQHPPVPEEWWQPIRDQTPGYNPLTTPTRGMGVVPELFRTWPGAVRSAHPAFSLAALGPHAQYLVADHALKRTREIGHHWASCTSSTVMCCCWASTTGTTLRCTWPSFVPIIPGSAICAPAARCW